MSCQEEVRHLQCIATSFLFDNHVIASSLHRLHMLHWYSSIAVYYSSIVCCFAVQCTVSILPEIRPLYALDAVSPKSTGVEGVDDGCDSHCG